MEIKFGKQLTEEDLVEKKIDLFLLAGNHEHRVFTSYNKIKEITSIKKGIILCYKDFACDVEYSKLSKIIIESHVQIYSLLDEELKRSISNKVNIVVDYSCMTKSWYYSIILYLTNKRLSLTEINVFFIYTPSQFSEPQEPKPNIDIAPLPGKYVVPTNKPKALIVCLGYEQNKAEGIIDHLDPKISYIFYTKPAFDQRFVETLELNNRNILESNSNIITYPFDDLLYLERELTALYYLLRSEYSIIIAPLGPKPFSFVGMLLSAKYKEIDIWRVGSGSDINEYDRIPFDDERLIISQVVWGGHT